MEDLKTLTVKYLRDLARKHLGKGHSKLKTREELIAALKEFLPASLKTASAVTAKPAVDKGAEKVAAPEASVEPAKTAPLSAEAPKAEAPVASEARAEQGKKQSAKAVEEQHDAEPLVEGFFVARVLGEEEARRHRLTDDSNRHAIETKSKLLYDEQLGELPSTYEDDTAVALPKDPTTVFFLWDFNEDTQRRAFDGLTDPRAILRVYDGETLIRELDFALESKSFYVQGLTPGRRYRLEAHAVGRDGESRRVGRSTRLVALPAEGPSTDTQVRFLRAPWSLPVHRMMDAIRGGEAKVRESHEQRTYFDMEEWEELANSASHIKRRSTERTETVPGRPSADLRRRQRMLGASDRHMGSSAGWPSGKK